MLLTHFVGYLALRVYAARAGAPREQRRGGRGCRGGSRWVGVAFIAASCSSR